MLLIFSGNSWKRTEEIELTGSQPTILTVETDQLNIFIEINIDAMNNSV